MREAAVAVMERYFGEHKKRIEHAKKVLTRAETIMAGEGIDGGFAYNVITLSAVMHDIGIVEAEKKHDRALPKHQEEEGPAVARELMNGIGVRADVLERVCYIVGNHHSKRQIDGLDFQILWEADYLVNVEDGWLKVTGDRYQKVMERNFVTETSKQMFVKLFN